MPVARLARLVALTLVPALMPASPPTPGAPPADKPGVRAVMPEGLARLARAYPGQIKQIDVSGIALASGVRLPYANGHESAPFEQRFMQASLKDQMSMPYPAGTQFAVPVGDNDPGRLRSIPFFEAMYGADERQVRAHLVTVRWLGRQNLIITSVNGVDKALARVSERLLKLPPQILSCAGPVAGGFVYRDIAGTEQLSAHSFGIAVDIGRACSNYWRWDQAKSATHSFSYTNRVPIEIVVAFEHEGFIWGGKWAHYDTMHFEYRPELLP